MSTVGDAISRVRNVLKIVKEDPFMTDRFIYSLIMKYGKSLMYRDKKLLNNLYKNAGIFREVPCVELIDVDTVSACCTGIKTGCTIKRSKYKLPKMVQLDQGYIIRAVTTMDYSEQLNKTEPSLYVNITKSSGFRYNKSNYFWIIDEYLFIPNVEWEAVKIQAMFEEDISDLLCEESDNVCRLEQERTLAIPEHLFSEIETYIRQELSLTMQIPAEGADDNQSIMR